MINNKLQIFTKILSQLEVADQKSLMQIKSGFIQKIQRLSSKGNQINIQGIYKISHINIIYI